MKTTLSWGLLGLLWLAFWLRLDYLLAAIFHIDEYITMLAATLVAEQGLPIFPSGVFYDHGLLFTFFSGVFIAITDFSEAIARWPSVLAGTLTVAVYYAAARALFGSRLVGLLAAILGTLDALSIVWSGRARMYSLAHLFVLLSIAWSFRAIIQSPTERARYFLLFFIGGAALSHSVSVIMLPPITLLALIFTRFHHRRWLKQPRLWLQGIIGMLILAGVVAIIVFGQNGNAVSIHRGAETAPPDDSIFLSRFIQPGVSWSRLDDLLAFFWNPPYGWLLIPIGLISILVAYRLIQKRANINDQAFAFLALYIAFVTLEMGIVLGPSWQEPRYLFILALPALLLLAAEGLSRLLIALWQFMSINIQVDNADINHTSRQRKNEPQSREKRKGLIFSVLGDLCGFAVNLPQTSYSYLAIAGAIIIALLFGPRAWREVRAQSTGDYNTAFNFVKDQWQDGDRVMTVHPAAAYLYLGRNDFYASQTSARLVRTDDETLLDRYTATPLINTVESLNRVLAEGGRLWFVVDIGRLYGRLDFLFTQQIFGQMNHVRQYGPVHVFVSETFPRPIPVNPDMTLDAQFSETIRLEGYSLDLKLLGPDGSLPLYLYWRPLGAELGPNKVFVQLRNAQNETIAQADHFIFEQLMTAREWQSMQDNDEPLREAAVLNLPSIPLPTDQGPYQIYIGLYHPDTFERLSLRNDASGENAVVVPFPAFP